MIYLLICGVFVVNAVILKWDDFSVSFVRSLVGVIFQIIIVCGLMPFVVHFAMMLDRKSPKTES